MEEWDTVSWGKRNEFGKEKEEREGKFGKTEKLKSFKRNYKNEIIRPPKQEK